ncbi:MAG: serine/threonine-protein kinase [Polyangia bacterium]
MDSIPPTPISIIPPLTLIPPTPAPVSPPFALPMVKPRPEKYRPATGSLRGRIVRNRFRISQPLGKGGMSSVYLARDVYDGTLYAVKVLRADRRLDEGFRWRFVNEVKAVRLIDHPAVVRVHDVGELGDGRLFLVMEYVPGVTLRRLIKSGPLDLGLAIPVICTIADGLRAAHRRGVFHRDLKPGNVLIPRRTSPEAVAKVVDFGIARISGAPTITNSAQILGTPLYISPEQAAGDRVDHRTDIYSLGVMMYQVLTGVLPFFGKDSAALVRQHIHAVPRRPSEVRPDVPLPSGVEDLIMSCLAKKPWRRPQEMREIIEVLSRQEGSSEPRYIN